MFIFIVLAFLTGTFVHLLTIFCIVLFHELGHYAMARFFGWRIKGIVIWLFGGIMETDEHGTKPVYEDVLVTIAGPFQHIIIYIFCGIIYPFALLPTAILESVLYYNTVILLFNLLPIWPLDGGKLLFLSFSKKWPYKKAHKMTVIFSSIMIVLSLGGYLIIESFSLGICCLALFLLFENHVEWKRRSYVFLRFLLDRYENKGYVGGVSPIAVPSHCSMMDVFALFKREKRHQIYIVFPDDTRKVVDEMECLRSYFHDKQYDQHMADVAYRIT